MKPLELSFVLGGGRAPMERGAGGKQDKVQPGLCSVRGVSKTSHLWNVLTFSAGISNNKKTQSIFFPFLSSFILTICNMHLS